MSDDYLWDGSGEPDPEVARLEKALAPLAHEARWREPPRRLRRRPLWIAGGTLALAAAIALAVGVLGTPAGPPSRQAQGSSQPPAKTADSPQKQAKIELPPAPLPNPCAAASRGGFAFEISGAVTCGEVPTQAGTLPVGVWLETRGGAGASLKVANIGAISLHENSRLRIVESGPRQHRLELVQGTLHAKVDAPPRLFVIDTRAASAVDLGCAYELSIDDRGRSHLAVTTGAVSLEGKGKAAYVPRGARVVADPERGPGTVFAESAGRALRAAILQLDTGDPTALAEVLRRSGRSDSVTLWSLLSGAAPEVRERVVRRLDELRLRPAAVKREALESGRPEALQALLESFEDDWFRDVPEKTP